MTRSQMPRGSLLSALLLCSLATSCAGVKVAAASEELCASSSDESSGIWIQAAIKDYTVDQGCESISHDSYTAMCSGLGGFDDWVCEPRTLNTEGTAVRASSVPGSPLSKALNDKNLCPTYVHCSCSKPGHDETYTGEMCQELRDVPFVDHTEFLDLIKSDVCPSYIEACEENCESSREKEQCNEQCTTEACLADFPRYEVEFMKPYGAANVGCWGRLERSDKVASNVLNVIAEYESLSKCCYKQIDDAKEFKWCSGKELKTSWRLDKRFSGRKVCDGSAGWHGASALGVDASTQEKCETLG